MDSNFQTLPTNVSLIPNQPLQIIRAEITSDLNLAIDLINISSKPISRVIFAVVYKDEHNNYLFNATEVYYDIKNLDIPPKKIYFLNPFSIDERFKEARGIDIRIKELYYSDSDSLILNTKDEKQFTLPLISETKSEKMKTLFGPEIISYGENFMNGWRCVCGFFNKKENEECSFCGRNKNFVLNNLTEPLINMKLLNVLSNTEDDKPEEASMASHLTQTHLTKVAPTTTSLSETRINESTEEGLEEKSIFSVLTKVIYRSIIALLLVVVLIFAFQISKSLLSNRDISNAKTLISQGKYEDALKVLNKIENEKLQDEVQAEIEKTQKLMESQRYFDLGNSLILQDKYIEAIKNFNKVSSEDSINFASSQDKIEELEKIILNKANTEYTNGNYEKALSMVNEYLAAVPESANATNLKNQIIGTQSEEEKTEEEELISGSLIDEEAVELDKNRAEMTKKAEALLNTFQKVVAEKANLRAEPSTDAKIITVLPTDSDLYIQETQIEGSERIWCKVEAEDAKTGEIFHGWISNILMEE
ncbi:SH3 domain-containing protein [Anaerosphaera multitolerans]|nr:SH3 domain-containing protein [Anaerosphaera multitolerans]